MKNVPEILEIKGRGASTIEPDSSVREALSRMADKDIGALVVMERERR